MPEESSAVRWRRTRTLQRVGTPYCTAACAILQRIALVPNPKFAWKCRECSELPNRDTPNIGSEPRGDRVSTLGGANRYGTAIQSHQGEYCGQGRQIDE